MTVANKDGRPTGYMFSCEAKDCGMYWTTNHNKPAVCGLISQPITAYVSHIIWQPSVAQDWIGLSSVLRPRQHSIGYMGDGFYRSKDPTNSIKVLKEQTDCVMVRELLGIKIQIRIAHTDLI